VQEKLTCSAPLAKLTAISIRPHEPALPRLPLNPPPSADPQPALAGLRVLDLSRVLAGPLCTMILGDLGADVIKVERPVTGDDTRSWGPPWSAGEGASRESAYFLSVNRNKRSITADLSLAESRQRVRALALGADVVVENFAPGTLEGWDLGYERLAEENPGLVLCSITGFGSSGPEAAQPGYDFAVQARAGWMAVTGESRGAPMKVGFALVDVLSGQNAALGILAALRERDRSGKGQRVEISLLDSAVAGLVNVAQSALVTGREPGRFGNAHPAIVPYQLFDAADRPFALAVGNDRQWRRLCALLELAGAATDQRFATNPARVENREPIVSLLSDRFGRRPASEWLALLRAAGIPCASVQGVLEAVSDPGFRGRGGLWEMRGRSYGEVGTVASPLRLQRTPPVLSRAAPALGEHTREVEERGWQ
jgi:crotonobetainyl-CoA:carnitine CoA-transferase CaiB-like acyl-CoA transferase